MNIIFNDYLKIISKLSILMIGMNFLIYKASAEYRAYQYIVSSNPEQKSNTIFTTSLTPHAMTRYYGISTNKLYLLRTWICPGNTARKKICQPPYQAQNLENFLLEEKSNTL